MARHRKNRVQLLTPINNWRVFERNFRKFVQFDTLPLLNSEETFIQVALNLSVYVIQSANNTSLC